MSDEKTLTKTPAKHGSVLVLGGGISGIQSALDLADAGFKVYLVEKQPSIGGTMPQLDKTFPTNDCAMCILAPKLVATGRHPNIELITYSDLKKIQGEPGDFTVTINKKARFVDEKLCNGCGLCVENCLVRFKPQKPEKHDAKKGLGKDDLTIVDRIINTCVRSPDALIPVLQAINEQYKHLPKNILKYVSQELEVPLSQTYHVATFYTSFSLKPRGKHLIKVCMGTACHVRGSPRVLDEIQRHLRIEPGETTDDGMFTLETVNCLGACALGPVVVVDDTYHPVSSSKVDEFLKKIRKEEG
jgi:NADH:ubiquinone oxidoreductase subunit E/NAD-dependent dihydropyrimidine dehydrogenase PreA subunit